MSRLPTLIGHHDVLERLKALLERNRLAHAILFTGPDGIGKFLAARWLAARILCTGTTPAPCAECDGCIQVAAQSHPDLIVVEVLPGKREIGIDRIRQVKSFVSLQAVSRRRKIAIVNEAERLSVAAQNALLKTLEEPPGQALMILVTSTPDGMLPTVRSRCQRVPFRPLSQEQVEAVLENTAPSCAASARELSRHAQGSPGRALRMQGLLDDSEQQRALELLAELHPDRYVSVIRMSSALGRSEQEMAARLELLLAGHRDQALQILAGIDAQSATSAADLPTTLRRAEAIGAAIRTLRRRNLNRSLLAEALALRLAKA